MTEINHEAIREDLYQAVNGEWIEQAVIPDDKPAAGGFHELRDNIEELLMADLEKFAKGDIAPENDDQREMTKFYQLAQDFERRNAEGAEPLQAEMDKIIALNSIEDFQSYAKDAVLAGKSVPFDIGVQPDMKNTEIYELMLSQPSTILPDKNFYNNPKGDQLLDVYRQCMTELLKLAGFTTTDAGLWVQKAIEFDGFIWPRTRSHEDMADYVKMYNPRTLDEVEDYAKHLSFTQLFEYLVGDKPEKVVISTPEYFERFNEILIPEHFEALKGWLLVNLISGASGMLSEELRQAGARFDLTLSGSPEAPSQIKNAFNLTTTVYDQVIGCYYGKKYFGPEARKDVEEMVKAMIEVYKTRLSSNEWLSEDTIEKAIVKLNAMDILIGYPDDAPEVYHRLTVDEEASLYENTRRFNALFIRRDFDRWHDKVDPTEWGMSAEMVNAYYNPSGNLICFPAAILQAPFYSLEQSASENFGGIGAVIGHEISHAFDNNGAQFDEHGNLNNWWTDNDYKVFRKKSEAMIQEFEGLPLGDGQVNGKLTVSENIADAGGLNAAWRAMSEDERDAQAFFINWAKVWCSKMRPEYQDMLLNVDVHAPAYWRANKQPQNMDAFYEVFDVQPGDQMYLAPEKRVVIW